MSIDTHTPSGKPARYGYFICMLIFLSYILVFFHRLCPAVIALDLQEAFGVGGTLLGVLGSAYFTPYALMQLPAGLLADSWGPRRTVPTFFLVAAAGSVLMGLAPNLGVAILGRILVGAGVATVFACNFKIIAEWFPPKQFAVMGGMFMLMGGVGALSAGAPLAWASDLMGWRTTLLAVAGLTLIMAALDYAFIRDQPAGRDLSPAAGRKGYDGKPTIGLREGMKMVLSSRRFWPISLWAFLAVGTGFALGGLWGGPYLMQVHGLTKAQAGGVLSTFAIALIVGSPVMGWLSNRVGRKPVLVGSSVLLTVGCATLWAFTDTLPLPGLYGSFFLIFLAAGPTGAVIATVSKELFPLSIAGTSVGMVNLFPFFGGAVLQVVAGAIVSRAEGVNPILPAAAYQTMFLLFLLASLGSLAVTMFLVETLGCRQD
jgi:sugar phosphate permease